MKEGRRKPFETIKEEKCDKIGLIIPRRAEASKGMRRPLPDDSQFEMTLVKEW